ncbi:MAG TPA: ATP-binding protein [Alphaproteobacteria bacterium]|nr:ATP-binding protein [Alphaproteobacteria bacterium]
MNGAVLIKSSRSEPYIMNRIFVRNYALFFLTLVVCAGALVYVLIAGDISISRTDERVSHTHQVISSIEQLSGFVQGMVADQRGYVMTGKKSFLSDYESKKNRLSAQIARLAELIVDNPSQSSRLNEIRDYFLQLSMRLEERAAAYDPGQSMTDQFADGVEIVSTLKDSIIAISDTILDEEHALLSQRLKELEEQERTYFITIFVGVILTGALLLLSNGFLLQSHKNRNRIEASLRDTEERFALAVEGTQDGIFDWDLRTGKVFYSGRLLGMLGYEDSSFIGTMEDMKELLYPEDAPRMWQHMEDYLAGNVPEYFQEFRLKSRDGAWIWVQARAKSIVGMDGKPVRVVGAHTDISLLKERQEKLENEKKAAEEANRAKSDFLAHMSHEIRTPLTAISGIAEIFEQKQDNLNDKQKRLIKTLHSSTSALKELINDILDFSKINSGELELELNNFELAGLFETVISMMGLRANEKGISFVFDYKSTKNAVFHGDQARIRQILINLIGNALKFTEEGGVSVAAYPEERDGESFLRVDVTDTGIGIAPENFDVIFERFRQADSSVSRKYGGTGLGLPISQNLAKLMGGKIILSSEAGKGSTFTLLLPDKEGTLKKAKPKKRADTKNLNRKIQTSLTQTSKILMVEDYEGNITVIGCILDDLGYAYDIAHNGQEALDLLAKNPYDIILMDVQMPVMDGLTATSEIRKIEKELSLPRTPIIGMTAHALVGDKDKCIEAGMDAYLPKPIVEVELKQEILKYLGSKKEAA